MKSQNEEQKKETETKILDPNTFKWVIPECCREGWDSCKHVPKREKKEKVNIGL